VVRDLEQVPALAVVSDPVEQVRVVVVFRVTGEQDALAPQADGEHDGGAIDGASVGEDPVGKRLFGRPEHVDPRHAQCE
jgi:hypothetical protein